MHVARTLAGPAHPRLSSRRAPEKGHGAQDMSLTAFFPTGEAAESRDALAKTLYARLFDWLVAAINKKINSLGE